MRARRPRSAASASATGAGTQRRAPGAGRGNAARAAGLAPATGAAEGGASLWAAAATQEADGAAGAEVESAAPETAAPALSGTPMLRRGSRGSLVSTLQGLLRDRGYRIAVDGIFGLQTHRAVRAFQASMRLSRDGIVGPRTAAALSQGGSTSPATGGQQSGGGETSQQSGGGELTGRPMLRRGSGGPLVRQLQELLNEHGAGITADGEFGALTTRAVMGFQRANGLEVDGVVGPATVRSLQSGTASDIAHGATGPATGDVEGEDAQAIREEVLEAGRKHLGAPYSWGADGPGMFDCSGFVLYVLRQETGLVGWGDDTAHGIRNRVPSTTNPRAGDLVFYWSRGRVTHIEFATGNGTETLGASGGGSNTYGDNPRAKVQYGNWNRDGRSKSYGSIAGLIDRKLASRRQQT